VVMGELGAVPDRIDDPKVTPDDQFGLDALLGTSPGALWPLTGFAVCFVALEATPAESQAASLANSNEAVQRPVRSVFLAALAVYYLFCTSVIPSLHSCFPFADGDRGWEPLGGSAFHEEGNHAPGSRGDVDRSDALDEAGAWCVACLFGAWLRGLSPPAGVSAPVLAATQRIPRKAVSIPALAHLRTQILPRAPPADTPS
jgi:hypothetical protein